MGAIGGRKLNVKITGGTPSTVLFAGYLTNARFNRADSENDTVTFFDASQGGAKDEFFQGTALQDDGADGSSFFAFQEANVGTDVLVTIMPQGNSVATTTQPHRAATCTVPDFDGDFFGGEANPSATFRNSYEFSWPCTAKSTKKTS